MLRWRERGELLQNGEMNEYLMCTPTHTVFLLFLRIDTMAFLYFGTAAIRGQRLFKGGVYSQSQLTPTHREVLSGQFLPNILQQVSNGLRECLPLVLVQQQHTGDVCNKVSNNTGPKPKPET